MAKETQKAKIERLEHAVTTKDDQLKELSKLIGENMLTIMKYEEQANEGYAVSTDKKHMEEKIFILEQKLRQALQRAERAEKRAVGLDSYVQELKSEHTENQELEDKSRTTRNAGRKPRFTDAEKEAIKMYRIQGMSMRAIAKQYACSVGLICNILKET